MAAGDGLGGGHWHLLPHLGIRVQTGALRGNLLKNKQRGQCDVCRLKSSIHTHTDEFEFKHPAAEELIIRGTDVRSCVFTSFRNKCLSLSGVVA